MGKYLLALAVIASACGIATGQTTVTVYATGTAGSFNTGSVTPGGVKNDDAMVGLEFDGNRGWAKFDLSVVPDGAIVTTVKLQFSKSTSLSSGVTQEFHGFIGDPISMTGPALYQACANGPFFRYGAWINNTENFELATPGRDFVQDNLGSMQVCFGFVVNSATVYDLYGYGATQTLQPQLHITYNICSGTPAGGTTVASQTVCQGANLMLSLSGASTGEPGVSNQWQSSADGITYANISGQTGATASVTQSAATFYQCVLHCSGSGLSSTSTPVKVFMCQSITWGTLPTKTIGDGSFSAGASTNSGLPLAYTSSNPAAASIDAASGLITINGAGTTTITVTQGGNSNFAAAADVSQQLTINKAASNLIFLSPGTVNFANQLTLSASSQSGGTITFSVAGNTGSATLTGNVLTPTNAGTVTVTAQVAESANYLGASVTQLVTIVGTVPSLTFTSADQVAYGAKLTLATSSPSQGQVTYTVASGTGSASILESELTPLAAGTVTVTADKASAGQYNSATATQVVTITKGEQSITFLPIPEKTLASAPFFLSAVATSGLPVVYASSNTSVATVINGNTISIVGIGTSTITVSQSGSSNYNAAPAIEQLLTVTKTPQTIVFASFGQKTLGNPPFPVSASASSGLPVTFSSTSDKMSIAGNMVTLLKGGLATITASQAGDSHYAAATADVTFCISPAKPTVSVSVATGSAVLTSSVASTYQWYKENILISGATSASYTPVEPGAYAVVVSVDGCISVISDNEPIIVTGLEKGGIVDVYPNPAGNELFIDGNGSQVSVLVFDVAGRIVDSVSGEGTVKLASGQYEPGCYFLSIKAGDLRLTRRVIKK